MTTECLVPTIIIEDSDADYISPTSDKLEQLKEGKLLKFNPADSPANRTIDAGSFLLLQNDNGDILKSVRIENAIINIDKKLDLRYVNFKRELSITNSTFNGAVDFSFATFEGQVRFDGSTFEKEARFIAAHAKYNFDIVGTRFIQETNFEDLHVDELLDASGAQFNEVNFQRIRVCKNANFSPHEEKEAKTEGAHHHDDDDDAAGRQDRKIVKAYPVCFKGDANFSDSIIEGAVDFRGAQFHKKATFARVRVESTTFFSCYIRKPPEEADGSQGEMIRTEFSEKANFIASRFGGNVSFLGVLFKDKADFERIRVGGHVLFDPAELGKEYHIVEFMKEASFLGANVNINAQFLGAQFKGKADFELMQVGGNMFLRPFFCWDKSSCTHTAVCVRFEGATRFMAAHVKGIAEFTGAQFVNTNEDNGEPIKHVGGADASSNGTWKKQNIFEGFCADGHAVFKSFDDPRRPDAESVPVKFGGVADFANSQFGSGANFERTRFEQRASFERAEVKGVASFQGTVFDGDTTFRGAHFNVARFREESHSKRPSPAKAAFNKSMAWMWKLRWRRPPREYSCADFGNDNNLDMRGFTYERIEFKLNDLLDKLENSDTVPFDRQPYTQLEKAYLAVGDDYRAGDVYYALRRREHKQGWKKLWRDLQVGNLIAAFFRFFTLAFDFIFLRGVTRYGVRPFRLLFISIGFIFLGAWIFSQTGAVMLKEKEKNALTSEQAFALAQSPTTSPGNPSSARGENKPASDNPGCCNRTQAIGVSFNQFIPIVEIASGSQWKPSTKPFWGNKISYAFYGSLHRLAGAILVPLGLAALTGMLHRRERK